MQQIAGVFRKNKTEIPNYIRYVFRLKKEDAQLL